MRLEKIFKNTVNIYLGTLILTIISFFYESDEVNQINENISGGFMGVNEATGFAVGIMALILLIVLLISLYLLYNFKPLGKKLYIACLIVSSLTTLMQGPSAVGEISYLLVELNMAAAGALLVFLYFTPIKNKFISS